MAINNAQRLVKETGDLPVPLGLKNAPTALMKELGYGETYLYAHDHSGNFAKYDFLPYEISRTKLFEPGDNPRELAQKEFLQKRWKDHYDYDNKG
jgi:putative ATPase